MQLRAVVGDRPSRMPSHCRVTAQEVLPHEGAGAGLSPAGTAAAAEQSGLAAAPIEIGSGVSADTAWQAAGQRQQASKVAPIVDDGVDGWCVDDELMQSLGAHVILACLLLPHNILWCGFWLHFFGHQQALHCQELCRV